MGMRLLTSQRPPISASEDGRTAHTNGGCLAGPFDYRSGDRCRCIFLPPYGYRQASRPLGLDVGRCTVPTDPSRAGADAWTRTAVCRCAFMSSSTNGSDWHGTTIVSVRKGGKVVIAGDGQVSVGQTVMKHNARKVRPIGKGLVIGGFAGATADAFTLFERLESKLEQYPEQLMRACVELAKDWRTDRYLRRLEAMMIVADKSTTLVLTGTGDVLEPDGGAAGIGSGGNYALAAARALIDTDMDAESIARRSMAIASEICIYTNDKVTLQSLEIDE